MAITVSQLVKKPRKKKVKKMNSVFRGNPLRRGVVLKVYTTTPKKPNSAMRKVALVSIVTRIRGALVKFNRIVYIPGRGHNVAQHSTVLIQAGGPADLNGVKFRIVKGALDVAGESGAIKGQGEPMTAVRTRGRSKYGAKRVDLRAKKK